MLTACAFAALTVAVPVDLGWFMNVGGGQIYYDGGFAPWITSGSVSGPTTHTVIGIDVAGILAALDCDGLAGITITDTGANAYGTLSPGADVDLMRVTGIEPDAAATWSYDGPNARHAGEASWSLAYRTAELDSFSGAQEWDWTHVSLGRHGALTMTFAEPVLLRDAAPLLQVSEAGSLESFRVSLEAIVPGPGAPALLGVAAMLLTRRRRRRGPAACGP